MKKEKKLIYTDDVRRQQVTAAWNQLKEIMQRQLNLYPASLPPLVSGELERLFTDTEGLFYDKLTEGAPAHLTFGNTDNKRLLQISARAASDLLMKPEGWHTFIDTIPDTRRKLSIGIPLPGRSIVAHPEFMDDTFCFDSKGQLQFSERVQTEISEAGKSYIRSEKGFKILAFIEAVSQAYFDNDMSTAYPHRNLAQLLEDIMTLDRNNKSYVVKQAVFTKDWEDYSKEKRQQ